MTSAEGVSRRSTIVAAVALVGGIGVLGAEKAGVLDNALRGVGVKPHAEPDPGDLQRLARAADAQQALSSSVDAALLSSDLSDGERAFLRRARTVLIGQAQAVSATPRNRPAVAGSLEHLFELARTTADTCAHDALDAVSPAVAQVLASMAAGLDQLVESGKQSR